VKSAEVAVAVLPAAAARPTVPSAVPPLVQLVADGPQTKKLTEPVGLPPVAFPETTALSEIELPITIVVLEGAVVVEAGAFVTVKHSPALPSDEAK
jgi:hypothetical protein